jgi:hypothetical protein
MSAFLMSWKRLRLGRMGPIRIMFGAAAAAAFATAASGFPPPVIFTPAATPVLATPIIYTVTYAVSTEPVVPAGGITFPAAGTVVAIGSDSAAAKGCAYQVEWENFDGTLAGVSGPAAVPAPGGTLVFTTQFASPAVPPPPVPLFPYTFGVYSDLTGPFEGHAHIRVICPTGVKPPAAFRVDAGFVRVQGDPSTGACCGFNYKAIKIVKPTGNVGD